MSEIDYYRETIRGFRVNDLIKIAAILQAEGLTPDDVKLALSDIDRLVEACHNEFMDRLHETVAKHLKTEMVDKDINVHSKGEDNDEKRS